MAAIFHELLGAGVLKKYVPLSTGYGNRYDMHALYERPGGTVIKLLVEYKHSLDSIVKDLTRNVKAYNEINLLVAWDANEQVLRDAGFILDRVDTNTYFEGVTHELSATLPGINRVPVVLLKELIAEKTRSPASA